VEKAKSINKNSQKGGSKMNTYRKTAIMVGVFYIVATVVGLIGLGVFMEPILNAPDYLVRVSANESQVTIAALLELAMAVAVAGIGIAVYPVLRKHNESMAIGYLGARLLEPVIYIVNVISLLTLLTLSQEFVKAGAPEVSHFQTLGALLQAVPDWGGHVVLDVAVFPLGAMLFNYLLYRSKLIPRWLSSWGLIGAILYWAAGLLVMFALITPLSTSHIVLQAPLGLQELVFALWLIVKGFNSSAFVSSSVT
jgi:hypothetical protein